MVLTGAGRGFSTGGDLRMMARAEDHMGDAPGTTDIWRWIRNEFGGVVRLIARTDKAFVAALNGPAAGVGLAWALTCDVAIAAEEAVIVPAFGRLGLLPEVGTSWALTRALGYQGAFRYFASGEHLTAEAALEAGLVQEVVPAGELMAGPTSGATGSARCPSTRWRWPSRCCARRRTPRGTDRWPWRSSPSPTASPPGPSRTRCGRWPARGAGAERARALQEAGDGGGVVVEHLRPGELAVADAIESDHRGLEALAARG